jgi:hypothetical protein
MATGLVSADIASASVHCTSLETTIKRDSLNATVTARCTVRLEDLLIVPGLPASITLDASATELIDSFREQP